MTRLALSIVLLLTITCASLADDWPQWRGPKRDGVWRESGIIEKFDSPQIKRRWSVPIGGGYSGPTVALGRVFVSDRVDEPKEIERVHCFDWKTGKKLWSHSYPCTYTVSYRAGPRASITVDDGRAYSLGTMGHLFCFEAKTGKVLWKKDPVEDFDISLPVWGIAAAPLVEGDLLILQIGGNDGACIVALNKRTGNRAWAALDDPASYSPPVTIEQAGRRVLVCWTGTRVVGLNPESGKLHWQHPFKFRRWQDAVISPVAHNNRLFVSAFSEGSLLLKLRQDELDVEKLWRRQGKNERNTDALHTMMSEPFMTDEHIYGVDSYGEMRCLKVASGDRVWEDLTLTSLARWGTVHMVRNGDKHWLFNDRGELIIGRFSPNGFKEIGRAKLIKPTRKQLNRGEGVTWTHPAFAYKHVFIRNDEQLVCADLSAR